MTMYRLSDSDTVIRLADGAVIPPDPLNRDWRAYEEWMAAGNAPLPVDPAPFVWPTLSPRQVRLQLLADANLDKVQPVINSLVDPEKTSAQISWDHATDFLHDDPLMAQLAPAVGYDTPEKVQAFFVAAAQL